jgi:N-acetylglucosaminyldiphosphoundecaprenol N-acetyl-beta-D-mannosaminyltransferase
MTPPTSQPAVPAAPPRQALFGLPVDLASPAAACELLLAWTRLGLPGRTVVTINPELVVQAETDPSLATALAHADLSVADGIGITWALKRRTGHATPRVPGVDLAQALMQAGGAGLRVYFLGAKPGVAAQAAEHCRERFGIVVAGVRDGYFAADQAEAVASAVRDSKAGLLLTALGGAKQEDFNHRYRPAAVCIGVGGTLDVLAGVVERAPAWTGRLGLEWLWRIVTLRRWERAGRLGRFVLRVLSERSN